MMNTQWKKGYEEGFAAGWKLAKSEQEVVKIDLPYNSTGCVPTGSFTSMMDNYNITTGISTITLNPDLPQTKPKKANLKVIRNLTDHTEIV